MIRALTLVCGLALFGVGGQAHVPREAIRATPTEVVVTLASPPLSRTPAGDRTVAAARIASEQRRFVSALRRSLPEARVRWRYRLVANGIAVVVPSAAVPRLRRLPGVRDIFGNAHYGPSVDSGPQHIGATRLWAPGLTSAGRGMKIGIIDDGVDQTHPFFDPGGYAMPEGYPRGQVAYTTAKVIVARAFPPPGARWKNADKPFDPGNSGHGTHVAGIAAGNSGTRARGRVLSGVAPLAYIGNYKALTIPTDSGAGLDGNAPELVAAIEAAVADGMDVINLSVGEPEIEPSRDLVALALDAAADAGVVPVVAAGNDYEEFGRGSLSSPGSSARAITVGAVAIGEGDSRGVLAGFSAAGPTPLSLRLKPDVSAPGVGILSSVPGDWGVLSGTSMAAPHVAGGAALLKERHPEWSVDQVKAALIGSAAPAASEESPAGAAPPNRAGAGVVDLDLADRPLVLAAPSSVSFGLLRPGQSATATIELTDAGGGAGAWSLTIDPRVAPDGATLTPAPVLVSAPGTLTLTATSAPGTADGEATGFVLLTRNQDVRRIPYWFRVADPGLARAVPALLAGPGVYAGNTRGRPSLVSAYRYPEVPANGTVTAVLAGPEQVFRFRLTRRVANFGVVITRRAPGVAVEPRVVLAGDENRLTGYPALPVNLNPYLAGFGEPVLAAGAIRPVAASYDVVFDSRTAAGAGLFAFRFWVHDVKPPAASLLTAKVRRGEPVRFRLVDAGSGVDPATVSVRVDGVDRAARLRDGVLRVDSRVLPRGRHRLLLQASDYQESRNMENVPPILPNTVRLTATVVVR